jgi:hypothetical protein
VIALIDLHGDREPDLGAREVRANQGQNAPHDHGVLAAERPLVGPQNCRGQGPGLADEDHQRKITMRPVTLVAERQRLLPVAGIFGVGQIEDQTWRCLLAAAPHGKMRPCANSSE